ncbi:hypothetical protein [Pseudonocardia acaciae]|uniref:hypothetical protein n=1 Tax=Pseudonocardia acaciae TaxID=551276 RepID=UPI00048EDE25|nr:hypothetical protein [Pseudonocardia acaciae]
MPTYNERGVIAENYYDLQGLGVLDAARDSAPLPRGSLESTLRTVLQAVEIAVLNLSDLLGRATRDLEADEYRAAAVKILWARGFHRVLARLSLIPQQLGGIRDGARVGVLRLADSPGLDEYLGRLKEFDRTILALSRARKLPLSDLIKDTSVDCPEYNLIHLARIANQESKTWESNLSEIGLPVAVPGYREWILCDRMKEAVYERVLSGDTYFTQFRGLHQIPELLAVEVTDRIEMAIRGLRGGDYLDTLEHLDCACVLMEGLLSALPPMVDSLATSDYHAIRENLGQTSGSHSEILRYQLFTDLYEQLAQEVAGCQPAVNDLAPDLMDLLVTHSLRLRSHVFQWRDQHLHLPRNNLGGSGTKSLTGSPDAVTAVQRMGDSARAKDPMSALAEKRGLTLSSPSHGEGTLRRYLTSEDSLDAHVLALTGDITQQRFAHVQDRLGYFSTPTRFARPERRTI